MSEEIHNDSELSDVARLFFGDEFPVVYIGCDGNIYDVEIENISYRIDLSDTDASVMPAAHRRKRMLKIALYDALTRHTGRRMAWGALTGVRPTKLFYECLAGGKSKDEAVDVMKSVYRVAGTRADILREIYDAQRGNVHFSSEYINLYLHIPYCSTRCSYCSFVSMPVDKDREQVSRYVELLCDETERSVSFLRERGKKILSVYIGGGTPSALDADLLEKVLNSVKEFDVEFTCEAGRPDTLDECKLDVMRGCGVTRVCINPQTLNDATLGAIGRRHTSDDFFRIFEAANNRGFEINCDLIAGLPNESIDDFISSYNGIRELRPHNFTVHSLSKKNGSAIRYDSDENADIAAMLDYALNNRGDYRPYYLYRQKRQAGNLENVGFSLCGCECVNNITTMEETVGVMACGAGAISKAVSEGRIARFANMRDVGLYLERYQEKTNGKLKFFDDFFMTDIM